MTYWNSRALCLFALFFTFSAGLLTAQNIRITLELSDCPKTPKLYRFNGFDFDEVQEAKPEEKPGVYSLSIPKAEPSFFYIGLDDQSIRPILLGSEDGLRIIGSCEQARQAGIVGSKLNNEYEKLRSKLNDFRQRQSNQLSAYRNAGNKEEIDSIVGGMRSLDRERLALLDSLKKTNPILSKVAALNTYLSYFNNNNGRYATEIEYFANEYFRHADFSGKGYDNLPWVFEAFQSYATTMGSVGLDDETHRNFLEKAISLVPAGSKARGMAYGGVLAVLEQRQHGNLPHFAKAFLAEYPEADSPTRQRLQALIARANAFLIGGEAPDFAQETPEGSQLKLSELRGKVVLVDFWASWCGPCRRENPNVVRMYEKYKDKGFEILGVSLDQNRESWLKAIEADGLNWKHVSDLKGWQNEVAQTYSVRSIPATLLLDKNGRILARNLRGQELEKKLEEVFKGM